MFDASIIFVYSFEEEKGHPQLYSSIVSSELSIYSFVRD